MTQTLTIERLQSLLDELKSWQYGHDPVDDKERYDMLAAAEWAVIQLLANREAQPVGTVKSFSLGCYGELFRPLPSGTKLYTAPPAPAVPDERHAFESFVAQQFGEAVDRRRAKNGDNEYMAWDMAVAWIVWQRRAAMLAQPVSSGYKLNSPVIPDGWKLVPVDLLEDLRESAHHERDCYSLSFGSHIDTGRWKDELERLTGICDSVDRLLAVAPEGGN